MVTMTYTMLIGWLVGAFLLGMISPLLMAIYFVLRANVEE